MTDLEIAPAVVTPPTTSLRARLGERRLELNALALMMTTATTALLGLAFWTVATHFYSTANIGRGSALVASLTLLATMAQLNLGNVFARCLPAAGRKSRRFVFAGYAAVGVLAVVLGYGFVYLGFGDNFLDGAERAWFPWAIAVLAIFALQDFVLVSIRAARFIPVENVLFALAKLGLLVLLAGIIPSQGIGLAWVLPAGVAVLVVTTLLRRRGLAHPGRLDAPAGILPARRTLGGIVAGEYVSGAVGVLLPVLLPLIVVAELGLTENAYFAIPWLVASSVNLLTWNVASAVLVEGGSDPSRSAHLGRRALKLSLLIGGTGAVFELAFAHVILSLLGGDYASNGTALLRVLALAVPFNVVIVVWSTLMRIHNRMVPVVAQQIVAGAMIVTATYLFIPHLGITGVGLSYAIAQATSGVFLLFPLWRLVSRGTRATAR